MLCLDSDEAGVNAIERLCTGSLLSKTAEVYGVEILIASLPSDVKDPAEYIESKGKKGKPLVGDKFRKEVLDTAKDWTVWYLDRLLTGYDKLAPRGTAGSFAHICDCVSDFLSRFPNPAERTKRAHDVAGSLADVISGVSGGGEVSNALRIQLETDLVNMVTRKAAARESIERRIESIEGGSPEETNQKVAQLTKGDGFSSSDDLSKLSTRALKARNKGGSLMQAEPKANGAVRQESNNVNGSTGPRRRQRTRVRRTSTKRPSQPPLTPHFSGFDFENQSDADWLGLPREKVKARGAYHECYAPKYLMYFAVLFATVSGRSERRI